MLNSGGMLTVYFIRHGQAGSRQDYDRLSAVGREQSRRIGTWLARRSIRFAQAWSGNLARQRETARLAGTAYRETGADFPEIGLNDCWDEFDLDAVYRGLKNWRFDLSVVNVLNRYPPYDSAALLYFPTNTPYDPVTYDDLGRMISVHITYTL